MLKTQSLLAIAIIVLCVASKVTSDGVKLSFQNNDLTLVLGDSQTYPITIDGTITENVTITFDAPHSDIITISPSSFDLTPENYKDNHTITIQTHSSAGHTEISANSSSSSVDVSNLFLRITVEKDSSLVITSAVIGWIYFVAWSISFYPQIWENYRRQSVVGLNFDFLSLNIVGFILYSVFNLGLYCIPEVKREYSARYPTGLNPVKINDIVFAVHAAFATALTIVQCFFYERNNQKVSKTAYCIHALFAVTILVSIILAATSVIEWLDFLYYCSYVKLAITLIKYTPQAYMNYKRKSTEGWSIGNVLLDFIGGTLSMLQMILDAFNYDDWVSIFGDPTKFGLGLFSVLFDVVFMIQHYWLYREPYEILEGIDSETTIDT